MKLLANLQISQAVEVAAMLGKRVPTLETVILDGDWRVGSVLVYGTTDARSCSPECLNSLKCYDCPIRNATREFNFSGFDFKIALFKASEEDLRVMPGRQRYLNCKNVEEYAKCFSSFMADPILCPTPDNVRSEVSLIKNFRLVYWRGYGQSEMKREEERIRQMIINQAKCLLKDEKLKVFLSEIQTQNLSVVT